MALIAEDSDSDGWDEVLSHDTERERFICLLCDDGFFSPEEFFTHLEEAHNWVTMFSDKHWKVTDQHDWIRFVNLTRMMKPKDWREVFSNSHWSNCTEDLLRPALKDDAVLAIDIESIMEELNGLRETKGTATNDQEESVKSSQPLGMLSDNTWTDAPRSIEVENASLREQLTQCKKLLTLALDAPPPCSGDTEQHNGEHVVAENGELEDLLIDDSAYFTSYSHFSIHAEMIADRIRTEAYRDFFLSNAKTHFFGKTVLDVGCGTGILSLFAADAGARVYGLEAAAEIFADAQETIRVNGYQDRITLIHGRAETAILPVKKVDVIVSEWMGYFLLFESMLDSVLSAARRLLCSTGRILPRHYSLHLLGANMQESDLRYQHLDVWTDVYGYRMPSIYRASLNEAHVLNLSSDSKVKYLTSEPCLLCTLDLNALRSCDSNDLQFGGFPFQLSVQTETTENGEHTEQLLDALVGYFDVEFDEDALFPVSFSTSPISPPTHWKQTVFFLRTPIRVRHGDIISGVLTVHRSRSDPRGLEITLSMESVRDQPASRQIFMLIS